MHTDTVQRNADELNQLKLAGWALLCAFAVAWAGWVSLSAIANGTAVGRVEEREASHFETLQRDVNEIKGDVKQLLNRSRNGGDDVSDF